MQAHATRRQFPPHGPPQAVRGVAACLRPQRPCEASETCVKLRPFSPVVELLDAFDKLRDVVGYILLTTNASEEGRWLGLNLLALPICGQLTAGDRRECGQGPHSQMGTSTGVKIIRPFPAFLPSTPPLKSLRHPRLRPKRPAPSHGSRRRKCEHRELRTEERKRQRRDLFKRGTGGAPNTVSLSLQSGGVGYFRVHGKARENNLPRKYRNRTS